MSTARVIRGTISLSISIHLPLSDASMLMNPVILPPGFGRLSTNEPAPDGIGNDDEHDGDGPGLALKRCGHSPSYVLPARRASARPVLLRSCACVRDRQRRSGNRSGRCVPRSIRDRASAALNAASPSTICGSVAAPPSSMPIRRPMPALLGARGQRPQSAAAPSRPMNSRLCMGWWPPRQRLSSKSGRFRHENPASRPGKA